MSWRNLLFAHWPMDPAILRPHLSPGLALDTYDGAAWVSVVPFGMHEVAPRGVPALPGVSTFLELNVRTYVTVDDKPGVWFFSLDASNPLAVAVARRQFHLPYFRARMRLDRVGDQVTYASERSHRGVGPGEFRGKFRPTGPAVRAEPGSLDAWLTERYALYAADARGQLFRGEIHHQPWPLQACEAEIVRNTVCDAHGFTLPAMGPRLQFVSRLDVLAWGIVPAGESRGELVP